MTEDEQSDGPSEDLGSFDLEPDQDLSDIFSESDFHFRNKAPSELDDLAYSFILQFLENTNPLSPYGLFIYKKIQPERSYRGFATENTALPILGAQFPPWSVKLRKEIEGLEREIQDLKSKRSNLRHERTGDRHVIRHREGRIAKLEKDLEGLSSSNTDTTELSDLIDTYKTEKDAAEARIAVATPKIDDLSAQITLKEKSLKNCEKNSDERDFSLRRSQEILESQDKKYIELREQILSDWKFAKTFLREKIEELKAVRSGSLQDNIEVIGASLSISDEDIRVLQHMVLLSRVEFYGKFVSRVETQSTDPFILRAKLCNVPPDKFKDLSMKDSPLIRKGLVSDGIALKVDKRVLQILSTAGLDEFDILTKLAGVPASSQEHTGFEWRDVEKTQGEGARQLRIQAERRKSNHNHPPIAVLVSGVKGSAKTQGTIKLLKAAGYDKAVMAPEFDEDERPLSYSERLAYIRRAYAIGETIDGFALIIDEIDKMGGDKGATDSLELLRLCENPKVFTIATANDDVFSEAFKDRFTFSTRFHVPIADSRVHTFMALAEGRLPDLDSRRSAYSKLLMTTYVAPRAMKQAVELGEVGEGFETVKAAFEAKAELMTRSRSGLTTTEPIIEPWHYNYFRGTVRDHENTSHEDLLNHLSNLDDSQRGVTILIGGETEHAETHAFAPKIAEIFNLDLLWVDAGSFNDLEKIEATLNKASDMGLMVAVDNADGASYYGDKKMLEMLKSHQLPVLFICEDSDSFKTESEFYRSASFVVDCKLPSAEQRVKMIKQFLEIDVHEDQVRKMPDLTLDLVQLVAEKKATVLSDPTDSNLVLGLLLHEYRRKQEGAFWSSIFIESAAENDNDGTKPDGLPSLSETPSLSRPRPKDLSFLGPVRKI